MSSNAKMAIEILDRQRIIDDFHRLEYDEAGKNGTWAATKWLGYQMLKRPADMFLYHDVIYEVKPSLVIETGTASGGSALYYATLLDQLSHGKVISVDIQDVRTDYPHHPRIEYIGGRSSVDDIVLDQVRQWVEDVGGRVIVSLDSDHAKDHVAAELRAYADFVTPGSYLVVEDCNVGRSALVYQTYGPGPGEAVDEWLPTRTDFKEDAAKADRWLYSYHRWFRRRKM